MHLEIAPSPKDLNRGLRFFSGLQELCIAVVQPQTYFGEIFVHRLRGKVSLATISSIPERTMPRFTHENTIKEKQRMRNE